MKKELPIATPTKYKKLLKDRKIRLWQLSKLTGVSEGLLCRQINGTRPLSSAVENVLKEILSE